MALPDKAVILFDGVCFSCNFFVNAVIRSDRKDLFRFCAQQSARGREILLAAGIHENLETLFLIYRGEVFKSSSAVFETFRILGGFWRAWLLFSFLPRRWTDFLYGAFASRRYFFGKRAACRVPSAEERDRFLV